MLRLLKKLQTIQDNIKDNKYTLEAKNLATMLNGKIDIEAIENEGMQYSFIVKLK